MNAPLPDPDSAFHTCRPDPYVLAAAHSNLALLHADNGDPVSAFPLLQEAMAQVVRMGGGHRKAVPGNKVFHAPAWHAYTWRNNARTEGETP